MEAWMMTSTPIQSDFGDARPMHSYLNLQTSDKEQLGYSAKEIFNAWKKYGEKQKERRWAMLSWFGKKDLDLQRKVLRAFQVIKEVLHGLSSTLI